MNGTKIMNRRRGPDPMVKAIRAISGIAWLIVITAVIVVSYARPRVEGMFEKSYGITLRSGWDKATLRYSIYFLAVIAIVCFIGIIVNISRHRRKTDRFNKSLIFFGVGSLIGILIYMLSS